MVKLTVSLESRTDLAPGRYVAIVSDLEEKQGSKQAYIRMGFEIADGPAAGRKVWTNRSWDLFKPLLIALHQIEEGESRKSWDGDTDDLLWHTVLIDVDYRGGGNGYDAKLEPVAIYATDNAPPLPQPEPEIPFNAADEPLFASATAAAQQAVATGSLAGH